MTVSRALSADVSLRESQRPGDLRSSPMRLVRFERKLRFSCVSLCWLARALSRRCSLVATRRVKRSAIIWGRDETAPRYPPPHFVDAGRGMPPFSLLGLSVSTTLLERRPGGPSRASTGCWTTWRAPEPSRRSRGRGPGPRRLPCLQARFFVDAAGVVAAIEADERIAGVGRGRSGGRRPAMTRTSWRLSAAKIRRCSLAELGEDLSPAARGRSGMAGPGSPFCAAKAPGLCSLVAISSR